MPWRAGDCEETSQIWQSCADVTICKEVENVRDVIAAKVDENTGKVVGAAEILLEIPGALIPSSTSRLLLQRLPARLLVVGPQREARGPPGRDRRQ